MQRKTTFRIEFREVLAVLALLMVVFAMILEACGHPVPEWLKTPIGGIIAVLLGFYFVDSARSRAAPPLPPPADEPPAAAKD